METSFLQEYSGDKVLELEPNKSSSYILGSKITCHVATVRVYVDGVFEEPAVEALPPLPQITKGDSDGCNIS